MNIPTMATQTLARAKMSCRDHTVCVFSEAVGDWLECRIPSRMGGIGDEFASLTKKHVIVAIRRHMWIGVWSRVAQESG
jgi:hypothetical protein